MKNAIEYYYNLKPKEINNYHNYYYFYYNNYLYVLFLYNDEISKLNNIYNLATYLNNINIPTHQIIINNKNDIISIIDNKYYILYKILINNYNKQIDIKDINYLTNIIINNNFNTNWDILWSNKIDYLEYQINQSGKKYPLIVESFSYFVGLSENAISYFKNTILDIPKSNDATGVITHKKIDINNTLFNLYDPINIVIDYKIRDIAEYIKISFFKDNFNIFKQLNYYFSHNQLSIYLVRLLFARILYPSFYFNLYDEILTNKKEETEILKITKRISDYENYLYQIYLHLFKLYQIPEVEWLKKRTNHPH